ncbi:MAG: hypothetical protein E6Q98_19915 [Rhodospirillaceae bacterium]|nr:MAG: hypothetical protein E6Q98_19915 [Rhodospirillaceae bacterium]
MDRQERHIADLETEVRDLKVKLAGTQAFLSALVAALVKREIFESHQMDDVTDVAIQRAREQHGKDGEYWAADIINVAVRMANSGT